MDIKILESSKKRLKIELAGHRHTLPNILAKELWNDSDVKVSGYRLEHPHISNPVLVLETDKKDAKSVLLAAIERVKKQNKDFSAKVKKAVP